MDGLMYVALWMSVSVSMILFNKAVLSSMDFPYPMFMTTWHMLFATVFTQILSRTTKLLPGVQENKVDMDVVKNQILPVSCCFAISLVLSNEAYIYLSVSYIQMLKAFTPVMVLILSVLGGLQKASWIEINIVLIISVGVALTSVGEARFSLIGFAFQSAAVVFESSRLVLTGMFLKSLKLDSLSTLYYIAPLCGLMIGLAFLFFEAGSLPWHRILQPAFVFILMANGLVAFSLNIASVMLIKHTSALTLSLAGIVKDVLLVFMSMAIFKSPVSMLQVLGYSVSLLALNLHKEYKKNSAILEASTNPSSAAEVSTGTGSTAVETSKSPGRSSPV